MITNKAEIFAELDKQAGKDLITAIYTVRTKFKLSGKEMDEIHQEWSGYSKKSYFIIPIKENANA